MCVFRTSKQIKVIGLLPNKDSFPIPVEDEFGGDVLIGYRGWRPYPSNGAITTPLAIYSRHYSGVWVPGQVFESDGPPSTITQRGIYAYAEEEHVVGSIRGKVAIWGRALDFESDIASKRGCMGQYGYPLEIWLDTYIKPKKFEAWAETGVHIYNGLYPATRERIL